MALTTIKTGALADDAVTEDKIANAINTARAANTAKDLTALSASNLTSGTVPDARFPATLPAASAANLTAVPAANITGTLPAISGANLTSLTATNLTGTIADARFPATLPAASAANLTNVPAANITGTLPAIDGSNLTGVSGGKILKAEYGQSTTGYSTNSNFPQDAFSFTFTPASATSQIIITISIPVSLNIHTSIQLYGRFAVTKNDDTQLAGAVLSQQHDYMNRHSSGHAPTCSDHITMVAKDTPGSTSQQTYKVRYGRVSGYSHRVAILDESVGSNYGSMWSIIEFE